MATRKQTRSALIASIAHWRDNESVTDALDAHVYGEHCPLCHLFSKSAKDLCKGCPVSKKTGQPSCQDSPWADAARARMRVTRGEGTIRTFKNAARKEREFLESLLVEFDAKETP